MTLELVFYLHLGLTTIHASNNFFGHQTVLLQASNLILQDVPHSRYCLANEHGFKDEMNKVVCDICIQRTIYLYMSIHLSASFLPPNFYKSPILRLPLAILSHTINAPRTCHNIYLPTHAPFILQALTSKKINRLNQNSDKKYVC